MRFFTILSIVVLVVAPKATEYVTPTKASRLQSLPIIDQFDVERLDRSIDPCVNFYQYACNGWMRANPVPAQEAGWGTVTKLQRWNEEGLREILEQAAFGKSRIPVEQKVGDYYAACMDEKQINSLGLAPLSPELARIQGMRRKADLAEEVARLHGMTFAIWEQPAPAYHTALFWFGSGQDFEDGSKVVAIVDQAGLRMPDRDYYIRTDAKSVAIRKQYLEYLKRVFAHIGEKPDRAAYDARAVMEIETEMAKASMDLVRRRDPANLNHRMSLQQLQALMPSFSWPTYLRTVAAPPSSHYLVYNPRFLSHLELLLNRFPLEQWKAYLRAHLADTASPLLSQIFLSENFDFHNRTVRGQAQIEPRRHRCVRYVDRDLSEALGQLYATNFFSIESKQHALHMITALKEAFETDIQQLDWITPSTRQEAEEKLHAIQDEIGYPDHWRDYNGLVITRDDALGNAFRASDFEFHYQLAKIGQPVDRGEWNMTVPTANAYYDTHLNSINFPAGILQSTFFNAALDDAVNYGAIGALMAHEISHGFDDRGSKFDAHGNLRNWWMPEDSKTFKLRTQCIEDEYSKFIAVDGLHVNGKLTRGENTADNGGLRIAFMALLQELAQNKTRRQAIDSFTPEQRFFIAFGQMWCENDTPEWIRYLVETDQHSPAMYRVNGAVSNMPEFYKAFGCAAGKPMVAENACRVW